MPANSYRFVEYWYNPGPHDAFTLAGDVARLNRTLGYERATIVGHDAGGAVAWVFGASYAVMAEGLIVCNAPTPLRR
jgi:epoxide hydrolase 4